ncbi:hypothetical protein EV363DRAFT_1314107 [Boletus edulis]|nr:hypothetical protein EV363DRAFT_1314107 [Boletus edulis]
MLRKDYRECIVRRRSSREHQVILRNSVWVINPTHCTLGISCLFVADIAVGTGGIANMFGCIVVEHNLVCAWD